MSEAPDVYPDFPDDDEPEGSDDEGVEGRLVEAERGDGPRTGDPRVDEVLASLAGLDERPVSEHAAVFDGAHEKLRAALEPDRESA
jgi:hypothetical protein